MATSSPPRTEIQPNLWLDARRALWLATSRTLVVADLHWGYATSHRAHGNLLPSWGDEELVASLHALCADYAPAAMIWLGDSLHTLTGRGAAEDFLRQTKVPTTLLAGNHDARWKVATQRSLQLGNFFFHHGDAAPAIPFGALEIIGHHHPALVWRDGAGAHVKLPALVASPRRLILPAFSPWSAGTAWNDRLLADEMLWAVSPRRVFPFPPQRGLRVSPPVEERP